MERKAKAGKANTNVLGKILRRPIVRLLLLVVIIVIVVNVISKNHKSTNDDEKMEGYQRLVNVTDDTYTFVNSEGKVKKYSGYTSMSDFYYDTTNVSKNDEKTGTSVSALINANNKQIVKFGNYESIIQVVGGKYYKVQKDGKYGIITNTGKTVIEPQYDYISMTTVQEATEIVFECEKEGVYYFVNEKGNSFYQTDIALHSISYINKFNSDYDTIVFISVDGQKKYFDLVTGEELFADMDNVDISYNILKTDGKITFYDKKCKVKNEIDTTGDYSVDDRVYFRKYIVIEQRSTDSGNRKDAFTVYDSSFNKVLESSERISPVQDSNGNVYFIINESDGVRIIDENKKEVKVDGYEYSGNEISNLQYLVLNQIENYNLYEAYDFKGKKVEDSINEYSQKGFGLVLNRYNGENLVKELLVNGNKIELVAEDGVTSGKDYIVIENSSANYVSVVNKEGKVTLNKVAGTRLFDTDEYIALQNGDNVDVYELSTGKKTFTYALADYVSKDDTVNMVELNNAYYTLGGKVIIEKSK